MDPLSTAANVSAIIVLLIWFILWFIPLAVVFVAVRGMQRLLPLARRWLQTARYWVLEFEYWVNVAMRWLVAPVLFLSGLRAGMQRGVAVLRRR